jgi:hypothetical protein
MKGWLGQAPLKGVERPSLGGWGSRDGLGLFKPPTLRLPFKPTGPGLGLNTIQSFPEITSLTEQPAPNTLTGFSPQGIKQGVLIGLGGAGITYLSRFLPGAGEMAAMVGGVSLMGFGIYKLYDAITGSDSPSIQSFQTPVDQQVNDVAAISGKILEPSDKGQAELSSKWTSLFDAKRTFKIKFIVSNASAKAVTALIEFKSEQTSRPLVGDPETAVFSTTYVLELAAGESKVVPGFQPIKALESFFEAQAFRSQDITATLYARTTPNATGKKLDQVTFTAW